MKKTFILISTLLLLNSCKESKSDRQEQLPPGDPHKVIFSQAVFRSAPQIPSEIIATLKFGAEIYILEEASKTFLLEFPGEYGHSVSYEGKWLKAHNGEQIGYIFSALIVPKRIYTYDCPPSPLDQDYHISAEGGTSDITLCADGSFKESDFYICTGSRCSTHGCWSVVKDKVLLSAKAQFGAGGIGTPEACTHACYFKAYTLGTVLVEEIAANPYSEAFPPSTPIPDFHPGIPPMEGPGSPMFPYRAAPIKGENCRLPGPLH